MKVFVNESRRGIEVVVKYQEEALSERKVRRIMEKTFFFMEQVLSEPEIPCSQIQLLCSVSSGLIGRNAYPKSHDA